MSSDSIDDNTPLATPTMTKPPSSTIYDSDDDSAPLSIPVKPAKAAQAKSKPTAKKRKAETTQIVEKEGDTAELKKPKVYDSSFEASLNDGKLLFKIIEAVKDLVTEGNLDVTPDLASMQCMDSSHVSLVAIHLPKAAWTDYHCERNISLGINMGNFHKILKMGGANQSVTMKLDTSGDAYDVIFKTPNSKSASRWSMKLMDIDSEHLGIPEIDYQLTVVMPSKEFKRICSEVAIIGDVVTIVGSPDSVHFKVSGDMGSGQIECVPLQSDDPEQYVSIQMPGITSIKQEFALRYLNAFAKGALLCQQVSLKFHEDSPLCVQFDIEGGAFVRFYLAPKMGADELED